MADSTETMFVTVGEEFTMRLEYNASAGYMWTLATPNPLPSWLEFVGVTHTMVNPPVIGGGSVGAWTYKATGPGTATLTFVYGQFWGGAPVQTHVVYVTAQETGGQTVSRPMALTQPSVGIGTSTATLAGEIVNDGGEACTYGFEYWTDGEPGQSISGPEKKSSGESFQLPLTHLAPSTRYHFRAVAVNSTGVGYGNEESFTTLASEYADGPNPVPLWGEDLPLPYLPPLNPSTWSTWLEPGEYYVLAEGTWSLTTLWPVGPQQEAPVTFTGDAKWWGGSDTGAVPAAMSGGCGLTVSVIGGDYWSDWLGSPLPNPEPVRDFATFAPHTFSPSRCYWLPITVVDPFSSASRLALPQLVWITFRRPGTLSPSTDTMTGSLTVHIYPSTQPAREHTGTLSVQTVPVAGEIFVDGQSKGLGSWTGAAGAGSHVVSFGPILGYTTAWSEAVMVAEGQTKTVNGYYTPRSPQDTTIVDFIAMERMVANEWELVAPDTIVSVNDHVRLRLRCLATDGTPLANQRAVIGVEDPILSQSVTGASPLIGQTDADGYLCYPAADRFGDTGLTVKLPLVHVFRFFTVDGGAYDIALAADNHGFPSVLGPADFDDLAHQFDGLITSPEPGTVGFLPVLPPSMPTAAVPAHSECMAADLLSVQYPQSGTRNLWREAQQDAYADLCPKPLAVSITLHFIDRVEQNIVIYAPSATACAGGVLIPGAQAAAVVGCPILIAQAKKDVVFSIAEGLTDAWNPEINLPYAKDMAQAVDDLEFAWDVVSLAGSARSLVVDISYLRSQGPWNHASLLSNAAPVSSAALRDATTLLASGALGCLQAIHDRRPLGCIVPESYIEVFGRVDADAGKPLNVSHIRFNWSTSVWQADYGEAAAHVPIGLVFVVPPSAIQWVRQTECHVSRAPQCVRMEWGVGDPAAVASYVYALDNSPDTDPGEPLGTELSPDTTSVELVLPEPGQWYFHLAAKDRETQRWLPARHYRVKVRNG